MFTWICPQCGAEVPPAYSDCPHCAELKQQQAAAPPPAAAPSPAAPSPTATPPPAVAPPAPPPASPVAPPPPPPGAPVYPAPPAYPGAPPGVQYVYVKPGLPAWAVSLIVALAIIVVGGAVYYFVGNNRRPAAPAPLSLESPPAAGSPAAAPAPTGTGKLAKFIEVTGIRIYEDGRKPMVRFMVVNHSQVELAGISGTVTLRAVGKDDPIATIPLSVTMLRPLEGKEITAPLKTKLRAYELPDWQFIRVETQVDQQ